MLALQKAFTPRLEINQRGEKARNAIGCPINNAYNLRPHPFLPPFLRLQLCFMHPGSPHNFPTRTRDRTKDASPSDMWDQFLLLLNKGAEQQQQRRHKRATKMLLKVLFMPPPKSPFQSHSPISSFPVETIKKITKQNKRSLKQRMWMHTGNYKRATLGWMLIKI